jgi:putative SOS response-associated peptidase YedK
MCGRYTLRTPPAQLAEFFGLFREPDVVPRYNIAPTQQVLAIRFDEHATPREPVLLRWGLIPSWADDAKIGNRMINARSDTVATKPAFRAAFTRRRCLIAADGYYEWRQQPDGKQPYLIGRQDNRPFAFAGLWEVWTRGEQPLESCTIITTDANEAVGTIHDRMPVILPPEDYDRWLDPSSEPKELTELLVPYQRDDLAARAVSRTVNSPRHDTPECIEPLVTGER